MRRLLLALIGFSILMLGNASMSDAQTPIKRLSAQFKKFDGTEIVAQSTDTVDGDNGVPVYEEELKVPPDANVLYVTFGATGDVNGSGVSAWFTCLVDDAFCNRGPTFATKTPGWIALLAGEDVEHDDAVNYTWCTPIARTGPGASGLLHDLEIRMASNGAGSAFIEGIHVFVDASAIKDPTLACKAELDD